MFDAVANHYRNYAQQLPENIQLAAIQSALYSFAMSTLFSRNINYGLDSAALAYIVSTIGGLTMPIFRHTFADRNQEITWYQGVVCLLTNVGITQILLTSFSHRPIDLMAGAIITVALNLFLNGFHHLSTRVSPLYIFA